MCEVRTVKQWLELRQLQTTSKQVPELSGSCPLEFGTRFYSRCVDVLPVLRAECPPPDCNSKRSINIFMSRLTHFASCFLESHFGSELGFTWAKDLIVQKSPVSTETRESYFQFLYCNPEHKGEVLTCYDSIAFKINLLTLLLRSSDSIQSRVKCYSTRFLNLDLKSSTYLDPLVITAQRVRNLVQL